MPLGEFVQPGLTIRTHYVRIVERQMLVKLRQAEETLQRRLPHLQDVAETHVMFYEGEYLCTVLV